MRFIVYSQCLTACAACFLYLGISNSEGTLNWNIAWFTFSSTWMVYLFHRLYKSRHNQLYDAPMRFWVASKFHVLFRLMIVLILLSMFTCWRLHPGVYQFLFLGCIAMLCVFYVVPFFGRSLRDIPFLKSVLLAFVWSAQLIIFPHLGNHFHLIDWSEFMGWMLFFFAVSIPYDVRDIRDDEKKMNTLPQWLGPNASLSLGIALIILFAIISAKINLINGENYGSLLILSVLIGLLIHARKKRSFFFYVFFDVLLMALGVTLI